MRLFNNPIQKKKLVECKKSLRKSTYKTYAFTKGYRYYVIFEDAKTCSVEDNLKLNISFSKIDNGPMYYDAYFKEV